VKILVSGFGPFGEEDTNPSEIVAARVAEKLREAGHEARHVVLPVAYRRAKAILEQVVGELRPDIAIALGLYGGITHVRVERVALNMMDFSIPDVDGEKPQDLPIDPEGPTAYLASIPTRRVVERLREEGIPARLSYSAGTYLCNYVMYTLLRLSDRTGYPRRAGFIHIPYTIDIASRKKGLPASLPLDVLVKGVLIAVEETMKDIEKEK